MQRGTRPLHVNRVTSKTSVPMDPTEEQKGSLQDRLSRACISRNSIDSQQKAEWSRTGQWFRRHCVLSKPRDTISPIMKAFDWKIRAILIEGGHAFFLPL